MNRDKFRKITWLEDGLCHNEASLGKTLSPIFVVPNSSCTINSRVRFVFVKRFFCGWSLNRKMHFLFLKRSRLLSLLNYRLTDSSLHAEWFHLALFFVIWPDVYVTIFLQSSPSISMRHASLSFPFIFSFTTFSVGYSLLYRPISKLWQFRLLTQNSWCAIFQITWRIQLLFDWMHLILRSWVSNLNFFSLK